MSYAAASDPSAVYFSGRGYHSAAASIAATQNGSGTVAAFNHGNSPSFSDLIDIVNPLQHIPVIGTIYRQLTGDSESAMSSIIGGTLYGGPVGAAAAMLDLGVHDATGKSTGDNIAALFNSGTKDTMTASTGASTTATKTAMATPAAPAASPKPLTLAAGAMPAPSVALPTNAAAKPVAGAAPAPMAPTVLAQSANATPAAAKAAPSKPMVVAAAAPQVASSGSASDGPVTEGKYLVFGSNDGDAGPGTDGKSGQANLAPTAMPVAVTSAPADAPKQFAINGGNSAPAKALPAIDAVASANPTAQLGAITMQHPRVFPVPPRNGPASPQAVLPPPTTGPGALPGGKSQALSAQEMAVAQDPAHNFLSAYSQALDKYQAAQKLAGHPIQPAAAVTTSGPAGEDSEGDDTIPAPAQTTVH